MQRGEGIIRNLGAGRRNRGQEGGFAGVGQANQPGISNQFQAQPKPAFFPWPALIGTARRAIGRGFVIRVAKAAIAAEGQHHAFAELIQVRDHGFAVFSENLRAHGQFQHHFVAGRACTIRPGTIAALARFEVLGVAEINQRIQASDRFGDHIAALAAIAAIRAAEFDEFLAPKGNDAIAAIAGLHPDFRFIKELHGSIRGASQPQKQNEGPKGPSLSGIG